MYIYIKRAIDYIKNDLMDDIKESLQSIGKSRTRSFLAALVATSCFLTVITIINYNNYNKEPTDSSIQTLSKYGSVSDEVRNVQKKLKTLGFYNGTVDGVYGSGTKNAVIKFQKSRGLTADGVAGPKTLLYLGLGNTTGNSSYTTADYNLLSKLISGEARGESYTGQVAVGAVVLNRVEHASFPDTLAGVVYQNGAFDCVTDSNWYAPVTESAKKAAKAALDGWDPTGGAIYYYNPVTATNAWIRTRPATTTIGDHIFCK